MSYSWGLRGVRKLVKYEAPKGRRVNALGAYFPGESFEWHATDEKLTAEVFVEFLERLAPRPGEKPVWIVLDNYSVHKAKRIQWRLQALERKGLHLFFLPPYAPELNDIEPCWRHIKHIRMQTRVFRTKESLLQGVQEALQSYAHDVAGEPRSLPGTA